MNSPGDSDLDLKRVAADRGNIHTQRVAIFVRWGNDNTGAEKDAITMGQVMDIFDIRCTHHTLKITDSMPGWALANKIHKMILDYCKSKLHSM